MTKIRTWRWVCGTMLFACLFLGLSAQGRLLAQTLPAPQGQPQRIPGSTPSMPASHPSATKYQKTMDYLQGKGMTFLGAMAAAEMTAKENGFQPPAWSAQPTAANEVIQQYLKAGGTAVLEGDSPEAMKNRHLLDSLAVQVEDARLKAQAAAGAQPTNPRRLTPQPLPMKRSLVNPAVEAAREEASALSAIK